MQTKSGTRAASSPFCRVCQCACVMTVYFWACCFFFNFSKEYSSWNILTLAELKREIISVSNESKYIYALIPMSSLPLPMPLFDIVGIELFYLYLAWFKFRHWNINSINLYRHSNTPSTLAGVRFSDCSRKTNAHLLCILYGVCCFFSLLFSVFFARPTEEAPRERRNP